MVSEDVLVVIKMRGSSQQTEQEMHRFMRQNIHRPLRLVEDRCGGESWNG